MMSTNLKSRCQELVALFDRAPIKKIYGMVLRYDDEGHAIFDLLYNSNFDHAMGGIHGGAIATLLDNAGWFTIAPHFEYWVATVEFHVRLLEPVKQVPLRSTGNIVRLGKRISVANMEVSTQDGNVIAIGSGTFAVTGVPIRLET